MNSISYRLLIVVGVLALSFTSLAATDKYEKQILKARAAADEPIVLGEWHAGFSKVKSYADKHGLPLLAIWSNGGNECSHCEKLESCLVTSTFKTWMKDSGIIFYFGCRADKSQDDKFEGNGFHWCRDNTITAFPFVRFYWKAKKGTRLADGTVLASDKLVVDSAIMGDKFDNYKKGTDGAKACVKKAKSMFKQYVYSTTPDYCGGEFPFVDAPNARLQAEVGMTSGDMLVPVARTNSLVNVHGYTNQFVAVGIDSSSVTNTIEWKAGDSLVNMTVSLPKLDKDAVGKQITLYLLDSNGSSVATNHIDIVGKMENSPLNPYWIGERTIGEAKSAVVPQISAGEWTMDYALATNRAKQVSGYTLALISGGLWCKDCANVDRCLLETEQFKSWATKNNVMCAVVERTNKPAQLMSYSSNRSSDNYIAAKTGKTVDELTEEDRLLYGYMGGAGYLSRHMVSPDDAASVTELNKILFENSTVAETNGLRNPISSRAGAAPELVLLDSEGTVKGRIYQFGFSTSGISTNNTAAYIQRLNELVALGKDGLEEDNNRREGGDTITARQEVTNSLYAVDIEDWYKLDCEKGQDISLRLTGESSACLRIQLVNITAKGAEETLGEAYGDIAAEGGINCSAQTGSNCYIKVSHDVDGSGYSTNSVFRFDNEASTVVDYVLETDIVHNPVETANPPKFTFNENDLEASMRISAGMSYEITNLDEENAENFDTYFNRGASANIYSAKKDAIVKLTLTDTNATYRIWNTGRIAFETTAAEVSEKKDGSYRIVISRVGGSTGNAKVCLNCDDANLLESIIKFNDNTNVYEWADGQTHSYTSNVEIIDNEFSDGKQKIRFYLTQEAGSSDAGLDADAKEFILTINDDDKAVPGKLGLLAEVPKLLDAKNKKVVAREGTEVSFLVTRSGGTTGGLNGIVTAAKGTLSSSDVSFESRDDEAKVMKLQLPMRSEAKSVKVAIKGVDGAKVDSSSRYLTYELVPTNAPQFESGTMQISATRYVTLEESVVKVDAAYLEAAGALKIKKTSGSLPSGIKAKFHTDAADNPRIVFSGIPAKAGTFTAVYQVSKGTVKGLSVMVTVTVADPAVKAAGADSALNPSIAKTRTFTDIPVVDVTTNRMVGLLNVTIPRTGKVSAKYRSLDYGAVSFSSASWSGCDADGTLTATLVGKSSGFKGAEFGLSVSADGTVEISGLGTALGYANDGDIVCEFANGGSYSASLPASAYAGSYTVNLRGENALSGIPLAWGDGYVTMKMTSSQAKTGKMTYAGMLPNGKTFSGSAVLSPRGWDDELTAVEDKWTCAELPLLLYSTKDAFSGVLVLDRAANANYGVSKRKTVESSEDRKPYWSHRGAADECRYDMDMVAMGGKYVSSESLPDACTYCEELKLFMVNPEAIGAEPLEQTDGNYRVVVKYDKKKKTNSMSVPSKGAAKGYKLSFNSATGVVSGEAKLYLTGDDEFETVKFRAVVLPGWGNGECGDCSYDESDESAKSRPFIAGAAWFSDYFYYEDEYGRDRSEKESVGCAVSVGVEAGK